MFQLDNCPPMICSTGATVNLLANCGPLYFICADEPHPTSKKFRHKYLYCNFYIFLTNVNLKAPSLTNYPCGNYQPATSPHAAGARSTGDIFTAFDSV
jgi:hypothetical protein